MINIKEIEMSPEIVESEREALRSFFSFDYKVEDGHIVEFDVIGDNIPSLPESLRNLTHLRVLISKK